MNTCGTRLKLLKLQRNRHTWSGPGTALTAPQLKVSAAAHKFFIEIEQIAEGALPKPPLRVAKLIPELDSELMEYVLVNDPGSTVKQCFNDRAPGDLADDGVLTRLARMNMLTIEELKNQKDADGKPCARYVVVDYTDVFRPVRDYYFQVLKGMKFTEPNKETG